MGPSADQRLDGQDWSACAVIATAPGLVPTYPGPVRNLYRDAVPMPAGGCAGTTFPLEAFLPCADPHRVDASGNSLLHLAAQSSAGNPWVLKLLQAGVDPGLRNAQQKTFQAYFFATPERLLNSTAQQHRAAVRDWLSAHAIPLEATR
jgi:hypothetical protein